MLNRAVKVEYPPLATTFNVSNPVHTITTCFHNKKLITPIQAANFRPANWLQISQQPPIRMGFMVDKKAMGEDYFCVLRFSPVNIIPPLLHTQLFIHHRRYTNLTTHIVIK